jgi:LPS sulfotransferase NodH
MHLMVDPLTRTIRPFKWKRNRKPLSQEIRSTYKTLVVTLLVLGITTTSVYLYTNSLQPAKGYALKQLQIDYEDLQSDLRKLERQVIEAQSFIHLETSDVLRKMNVAENQDFSYVDENTGFAKNSNGNSATD